MISPFVAGVKNIVAVKGTAFTEDQLRLLRRFCDTLIIAFDSDFAGNTAALRSIEMADNMEFDLKVLDLSPRFKDPDEAIKTDPQFFASRLENTLYIWDFIIESAVKQFGTDTPRGKKQILSQVLPFIKKISNSVIRSDYYKKLATALNSDVNSILEESNHYATKEIITPSEAPKKIEVSSAREKLEENILTYLFASKSPKKVALKISEKIKFLTPRFTAIFAKVSDPESLPPEILPVYQNIYMNALLLTDESKTRHRELVKLLNQVQTIEIKEELSHLSQEIGQLEDNDPDDRLKSLEIRYNNLLVKLQELQIKKSSH